MKSWTIFKSHIIPLAKMRLFLRPVMRSLIVPQNALKCHRARFVKIVPDERNSLIFRVLTTQYSSSFHQSYSSAYHTPGSILPPEI